VIHRKDGKQFELATLKAATFSASWRWWTRPALGGRGGCGRQHAAAHPAERDPRAGGHYPMAAFKFLWPWARARDAHAQGNQKYIDSLLLASAKD